VETLPDYLRPGLDVVFVGINPGFYSAQVGHYFATARNRFWSAFNAAAMTPKALGPETDSKVLDYRIGFTDVVKRPTRSMSELKQPEFREGAKDLLEKLLAHQPKVVCFNGLSGYKNFAKYTGTDAKGVTLGLQPTRIGNARVFVLPSTSPANAAVSLERIVEGMRELRVCVTEISVHDADD